MTVESRIRTIGGLVGAAVMGLALVAVTATVTAQGSGGGSGGPGRLGRGGPDGGPGGGFGFPIRGVRTLSSAQRDELRAVAERHREEMQQLRTRVGEARRALRDSVEAGQVDESKASDLGAATSALALARARAATEALAILTPEQKAEMQKNRDAMKQWFESRPGGRADEGRRGGGRRGGGPR